MIFRQVQRTVRLCFYKFRCRSDRRGQTHVTARDTQLNRRFEVSTCRHVSLSTSIAPTSKLIKT